MRNGNIQRLEEKAMLKIETNGTTSLDENKVLLDTIRKINAKRRRNNLPRLQYKINLGK